MFFVLGTDNASYSFTKYENKKNQKNTKKGLDSYCNSFVALGVINRKYMNDKKLKNFNPMALREKYSAKSMSNKNNYSSFWLDNGWDNNSSIFDDEPKKEGC